VHACYSPNVILRLRFAASSAEEGDTSFPAATRNGLTSQLMGADWLFNMSLDDPRMQRIHILVQRKPTKPVVKQNPLAHQADRVIPRFHKDDACKCQCHHPSSRCLHSFDTRTPVIDRSFKTDHRATRCTPICVDDGSFETDHRAARCTPICVDDGSFETDHRAARCTPICVVRRGVLRFASTTARSKPITVRRGVLRFAWMTACSKPFANVCNPDRACNCARTACLFLCVCSAEQVSSRKAC
jgi:hypothetical protein